MGDQRCATLPIITPSAGISYERPVREHREDTISRLENAGVIPVARSLQTSKFRDVAYVLNAHIGSVTTLLPLDRLDAASERFGFLSSHSHAPLRSKCKQFAALVGGLRAVRFGGWRGDRSRVVVTFRCVAHRLVDEIRGCRWLRSSYGGWAGAEGIGFPLTDWMESDADPSHWDLLTPGASDVGADGGRGRGSRRQLRGGKAGAPGLTSSTSSTSTGEFDCVTHSLMPTTAGGSSGLGARAGGPATAAVILCHRTDALAEIRRCRFRDSTVDPTWPIASRQ